METGGSGDISSWESDVSVAAGQEAPRDIFCGRCSVHVAGAVVRDVVVFGGNAYVDGTVGRDVFVLGGNLHLGPHASIARDAITFGGSVDRAPGASIGRDSYSGGWPLGHGARNILFPVPGAPYLTTVQAIPGLLLLLLALAVAAIFPRQLATGQALIEARPATALGFGCLGSIGGFVLAVLLAVTVILLPFSGLLLLLMLVGWVFGWAVIFAWAGRRLLAVSEQSGVGPVITVLIGGLLAVAGLLIPVVNVLLFLIGGTVALGTALGTRFGTREEGAPFWPGTPSLGRPGPTPPAAPPAA